VKRVLLLAILAGCGGSTSNSKTAATLRDQLQHLTDKQQASFDSPADPLALSPTPDNGPFVTDSRKDCSGCPPR
jgi:hypothetical protein